MRSISTTNTLLIDWGNSEKTFIRVELTSAVSEPDFYDMLTAVASMVQSVNHKVDLLAIDQGYYFFKLQYLRMHKTYQYTLDNFRYMIMVGTPSYVEIFATVMTKVLPEAIFDGTLFFQDENKALEFLNAL